MEIKSSIFAAFGWLFGALFSAIGIVNIFWGNDPFYGIFILLLSAIFFPPVNPVLRKITGFTVPVVVKILLALFILWTALGVGELADKIELMMKDF